MAKILNNSGKTSILEVIESLECPNYLGVWWMIGRREGNNYRASTTLYDTMRSLFPITNEDDKKFKEGLLLNAYGDGMKKAMLLLSAVLQAKNGILLLDEFETAIHISVMGKVFKWVIENASKLNVQIFMTSHSLEAIDVVLKCCSEMQRDMEMITLVDTEAGVKVRNVDASKAIQLMDEYGLELR